jgi:hypothetical protein
MMKTGRSRPAASRICPALGDELSDWTGSSHPGTTNLGVP